LHGLGLGLVLCSGLGSGSQSSLGLGLGGGALLDGNSSLGSGALLPDQLLGLGSCALDRGESLCRGLGFGLGLGLGSGTVVRGESSLCGLCPGIDLRLRLSSGGRSRPRVSPRPRRQRGRLLVGALVLSLLGRNNDGGSGSQRWCGGSSP